tara:strand:+ start:1597 stop:1935 length:339 start_codon:yes stop_codon:yes gene_type:complete
MGAKHSLVVGAHIIDSGYDGEIFIDLHNIGSETQHLASGDKIAQLVLVPVVHFRAVKVEDKDLYRDSITISNRGAGSLGSTNKAKLVPPGGGPPYNSSEVVKNPLNGMVSGF